MENCTNPRAGKRRKKQSKPVGLLTGLHRFLSENEISLKIAPYGSVSKPIVPL
jgi:hypothetical protein